MMRRFLSFFLVGCLVFEGIVANGRGSSPHELQADGRNYGTAERPLGHGVPLLARGAGDEGDSLLKADPRCHGSRPYNARPYGPRSYGPHRSLEMIEREVKALVVNLSPHEKASLAPLLTRLEAAPPMSTRKKVALGLTSFLLAGAGGYSVATIFSGNGFVQFLYDIETYPVANAVTSTTYLLQFLPAVTGLYGTLKGIRFSCGEKGAKRNLRIEIPRILAKVGMAGLAALFTYKSVKLLEQALGLVDLPEGATTDTTWPQFYGYYLLFSLPLLYPALYKPLSATTDNIFWGIARGPTPEFMEKHSKLGPLWAGWAQTTPDVRAKKDALEATLANFIRFLRHAPLEDVLGVANALKRGPRDNAEEGGDEGDEEKESSLTEEELRLHRLLLMLKVGTEAQFKKAPEPRGHKVIKGIGLGLGVLGAVGMTIGSYYAFNSFDFVPQILATIPVAGLGLFRAMKSTSGILGNLYCGFRGVDPTDWSNRPSYTRGNLSPVRAWVSLASLLASSYLSLSLLDLQSRQLYDWVQVGLFPQHVSGGGFYAFSLLSYGAMGHASYDDGWQNVISALSRVKTCGPSMKDVGGQVRDALVKHAVKLAEKLMNSPDAHINEVWRLFEALGSAPSQASSAAPSAAAAPAKAVPVRAGDSGYQRMEEGDDGSDGSRYTPPPLEAIGAGVHASDVERGAAVHGDGAAAAASAAAMTGIAPSLLVEAVPAREAAGAPAPLGADSLGTRSLGTGSLGASPLGAGSLGATPLALSHETAGFGNGLGTGNDSPPRLGPPHDSPDSTRGERPSQESFHDDSRGSGDMSRSSADTTGAAAAASGDGVDDGREVDAAAATPAAVAAGASAHDGVEKGRLLGEVRIKLGRVAGALSAKMAAMVRKISPTWMNGEKEETRRALMAYWINAPEGAEIPLPPAQKTKSCRRGMLDRFTKCLRWGRRASTVGVTMGAVPPMEERLLAAQQPESMSARGNAYRAVPSRGVTPRGVPYAVVAGAPRGIPPRGMAPIALQPLRSQSADGSAAFPYGIGESY